MRNYKDKTKEELLEIIRELETQQEKHSVYEEHSCPSKLLGRFRDQYSRDILDTFPDMITVFDYDLNCVELVSAPQTNHVEGISNAEISQLHLKDIVPDEAYRVVKANMEEVIRTKEQHTGQHSLVSEGKRHYYENRVCPLGDQYLLCVCRDVTRRVNTENESQKQQTEIARLNSLMTAILDNIPVYLFVKNVKDDFRYLYWNKEFVQHSGIPAEKAVGRRDEEIFPNPEDVERFKKDDQETLRLGCREYEEDYTTATGETRVVHTAKLAVDLPNGDACLIGISWDITELKETEKELIAARKHAEESDRLKSAFLANMSHEIRTPLNSIVGFSRLVIDPAVTEEKDDYCHIIEKNSELLLNLFNDILDLSTLEAGALKLYNDKIDLSALFQKLYGVYSAKQTAAVHLKMDAVDDNLRITNDKPHLEQILTNLLSNAVKFTPSGEIRFGCQLRGNVVQFYVKDSGVGIAANRVATIFQRFRKVNNFAQGTGLGLTICRMLVERMGGRIWVRSQEGLGSTFYFTLPMNH